MADSGMMLKLIQPANPIKCAHINHMLPQKWGYRISNMVRLRAPGVRSFLKMQDRFDIALGQVLNRAWLMIGSISRLLGHNLLLQRFYGPIKQMPFRCIIDLLALLSRTQIVGFVDAMAMNFKNKHCGFVRKMLSSLSMRKLLANICVSQRGVRGNAS
jgi:hypothetical protein